MAFDDHRAILIAAATPLIARKGINGVGVREIGDATGVIPAMLSYYFGGKEETLHRSTQ